MSYAQELADVRAVVAGASGVVGALYSAGLIAWPGEDFDAPQPGGDPSSPVAWIDIERGTRGTEPLTFGASRPTRRIQSVWDFAVLVEQLPGCDEVAATYVDALDTLFTGRDSSTMYYVIGEAASETVGIWQGVWWRVDWRIPVDRWD